MDPKVEETLGSLVAVTQSLTEWKVVDLAGIRNWVLSLGWCWIREGRYRPSSRRRPPRHQVVRSTEAAQSNDDGSAALTSAGACR